MTATSRFEITERSKVKRLPERGHYDRALAYEILDQALICHVAISTAEGPLVLPMAYARMDDQLVLHGATASRLLQLTGTGQPISLCVTLLDGLVLARSVFHHSMNYRSVVVFGHARLIDDDREKARALDCLVEHLAPGQTGYARAPTAKELNATCVLAVPVTEVSVKRREGPPKDSKADYELDIWAGVVPLQTVTGKPEPDPLVRADTPLPEHIGRY